MTAPDSLRIPVIGAEDVSAVVQHPPDAQCMLVLAHGAGAGMRHRFLESLVSELAAARVATLRYQFPYMEYRRRVPDPPSVLTATVAAAVREARGLARGLPVFAGGKSMGGRMTSLAASDGLTPGVRGLAFFGFPLHPPNRPATQRADHLSRVHLPMLFLQGTRDQFAELELLQPICQGLGPRVTLHIIDEADHSFHVPKRSGKTDVEVLRELVDTFAQWAGTTVAGHT
jgi:predicted alpha/beta-hydrolase family hydrolase